MIRDSAFSPMFSRLFSPLGKVAAVVLRLESAAVHRSQSGTAAQQFGTLGTRERGGEQTPERRQNQQPIGRFLQRREVRHLLQLDRRSQRLAIRQQADRATVGKTVVVLQHQAGEQLVLRERFRAESMGIRRQRFLCHSQSLDQHALRTVCCLHSYPLRSQRSQV